MRCQRQLQKWSEKFVLADFDTELLEPEKTQGNHDIKVVVDLMKNP